jgi:7,8-dihydroneopterin aldolase/epimerase/oxygenase
MKLEIQDLKFKCIIGILKFERKKKQKVIVNISFKYEFKNNNFIDYSKIISYIKKTMKKKKFNLIEDSIMYITKNINKNYKIKNLKLQIIKPNIIQNVKVSLHNK